MLLTAASALARSSAAPAAACLYLIQGLGFSIWTPNPPAAACLYLNQGLGFSIWTAACLFLIQGLGFSIWTAACLGLGVQGSRHCTYLRVDGLKGLGFAGWGLGFGVWAPLLHRRLQQLVEFVTPLGKECLLAPHERKKLRGAEDAKVRFGA